MVLFLNKITLVLLDNSNVLERTSGGKNNASQKQRNGSEMEEISERHVLQALEKTSKVIQDIESLLATSRKQSLIACGDPCSLSSQKLSQLRLRSFGVPEDQKLKAECSVPGTKLPQSSGFCSESVQQPQLPL